ncbi:MAG TPA: NUDIX domain-containing protein [Gaiellaceae bacterium]|nr:NUDIX domain-containing protein [Gaiellaceae bacterium]
MGELDDWRHCPRCATPVTANAGRFECPHCGFATYAHSKPTASGVVVDDGGRLLLSKRAKDPFAGKWDLPGGFLEEGEHPLDGVKRELREEAGIEIGDERLLGIWMDRYDYRRRVVETLNIYYAARLAEGTPEPADDVAEFRWFAANEVPLDELAFAHIPKVLSAWRSRDEHA